MICLACYTCFVTDNNSGDDEMMATPRRQGEDN